MYVVGQRPLQVAPGETLPPGAPVPQAADWPNLRVYLESGRVINQIDKGSAALVVGKWPLRLSDDDVRQPGDRIPEAADWTNLRAYVDTGRVVYQDPSEPVSTGGASGVPPNTGRPATPPRTMMRRRT